MNLEFGIPPFRFFNSWLLRNTFDETFDLAWNSFHGYGAPDMFLMAKVKHVKKILCDWKNNERKKESGLLENLKAKVHELELQAENRILSESERANWREAKTKILELEKIEKMDVIQKAKVKWVKDGDENTKYFHSMLKNKNRKTRICGLNINGAWTSDPKAMKAEIHSFFSAKFVEQRPIRPKFFCENFKKLSVDQCLAIEEPITMEEIKREMWSCGGEKASGPDGFTFKLLRHKWELMKFDICNFVRHFERTGTFSKGCNSSFITLIPKVTDPLHLGEYRPISLIGSLYKITAKVLAIRLKSVIGSVVDDVQSAYIEGRNILDGPLIMNEIVSWAKRCNKKPFLFKVDFEKAFDSISWSYLESVMEQMNFGSKWRKWIMGCLSSARASVLVNSFATDEFPITRGVRQGDPLSPFLFILAMEGLHLAVKTARSKALITGIKLPNGGPTLSHLFYADDAIFSGTWDRHSIKNLSSILKCFYLASGLKVNFHKSRLFGVGTTDGELQSM